MNYKNCFRVVVGQAFQHSARQALAAQGQVLRGDFTSGSTEFTFFVATNLVSTELLTHVRAVAGWARVEQGATEW